MLGYKLGGFVFDNFQSFMRYEAETVVPFAINRLAHSCCYNVWMMPSQQFGSNYIDVVYTIGINPPNVHNVLVPFVPKDTNNYMGNLETIGYADSAAQYLACAFIANVGAMTGPGAGKMFKDASMEQIRIDIDLQFEGDKRELMHIL